MAALARQSAGLSSDAEARSARRASRIARIAMLSAHAHGVSPAEVRTRPRFKPKASEARMVAILLCRDLLAPPPDILARAFGGDGAAIERALANASERAARDPVFAATLRFLKASAAEALGLWD